MPSSFPPRPDRRRKAKPTSAQPPARDDDGDRGGFRPRGPSIRHGGVRPERSPRGRSDDDRPRAEDRGRRAEDGIVEHGRPRRDRPGRPPVAGDRGRPDRSRERPPAAATAWENQAGWYDRHQGTEGDDFYQQAILPSVWKHLKLSAGRRVLDVGCGQGVVGRYLAERRIASLGIDASPSLIDSATRRASGVEQYRVGDATALHDLVGTDAFDGATVVLALQDLDPIEPVCEGIAAALKPGARLVIVLTHPAFRIPKASGWGFDEERGVQYRRVEAYLTPQRLPILTHPGRPDDGSRTWSHHRPLSAYVNALGAAGFGVVALDELCSHRRGTQGRRSAAEDRALREIPLFLVIVAQRR